jgi:alkylation response protein AidB-like acyl-CoA dehydrogenase
MIDFSLTKEQLKLREVVRNFAEKEVKPAAAELDAKSNPADSFPWKLFEKAHALGLTTLALSKDYGGGGIDILTAAILIEEACAADAGFGIGLQQIWFVSQTIQKLCSKEQCDRFLPQFRKDPQYFLSAASCEPDAGSDVFLPSPDPQAGIRLSARIEGDEVILNGTKHFIGHGDVAKLILVSARTDPSSPMVEGTTLFLVTPDAPGFRIGKTFDQMGWRLFPTAELFFENCRIPKGNQVLEWNKAHEGRMRIGPLYTAYAGAMGVGMARAAFERSLQHAKERVQGGVPIIHHQNTGIQLAEMYVKIEAARYLTWKACWNLQNEDYLDPRMLKAPKIFASEVAKEVALAALAIHGGSGVMRDVGIEKIVRDAITLLPVYAPNDVNLLYIARMLEKGAGPKKS